jgi:hypothetical protein
MIPCIFTHEEFITFFIRYSEPLVLREEQTNYLLSISSVTSMKKYRKITSGILGRNTVILLAFQYDIGLYEIYVLIYAQYCI